MIVASRIMGIAIIGTLAGISTSMRNGAKLMERDRAVLLARSKMNELLTDSRIPQDIIVSGDFDPGQTGGRPAGWRARVNVFEKPVHPAPGALVLDRIQLEVWWMAGSDRRTYALDGYRIRAITVQEVQAGAPAQ